MKKLLSILMALALALSLSVTALATTGSITVTNATVGETYYLYKVFDASYAVDEHGNTVYDATGKAIVAYTIQPGDPFFQPLFGDGTAVNDYFIYDSETGAVTKRATALDEDIITYLDGIANSPAVSPDYTKTATAPVGSEKPTVVFSGIDTGYYLLDRGAASIVTITNNLPNVNVIDKNQKPNVGNTFNKLVWDEDTSTWVESSSASIGDILDWKIEFVATNYDGEEQVLYYTVRDTKSSGLWVEFNDITVKVGTQTLGKGWYYCAGPDAINTGDWTAAKNSAQWAATAEEADWYLIHYGYDDFEIVIPWLDDYTFAGVKSTTKGYELTFDLDAEDGNGVLSESVYDSPSDVLITYSASVGPEAANVTSTNSATLDWITVEGTFGPDVPQTTETTVHNMGITKTANDGTATTPATRLAGAIFTLYTDSACTDPVYVIPTNNEGVYIVDDVDVTVSGDNRVSAREFYNASIWSSYVDGGTTITVGGTPVKVRADMTTPASGQLVILGLEAGTYYLKENEAPSGYNKLGAAQEVTVGSGSAAVYSNSYKDLSDNPITYTVYSTTIVNNKGVELPSTGGAGTMKLITIGTMVTMAFAVLLITHKKMSVYHDCD